MPLCLIDQSCAVIHGLCARGRGEGEEIYLLLLAFIKNQNYWNIHITSKAVCTIIYYRCKTKHETTRPLQCTMEVILNWIEQFQLQTRLFIVLILSTTWWLKVHHCINQRWSGRSKKPFFFINLISNLPPTSSWAENKVLCCTNCQKFTATGTNNK